MFHDYEVVIRENNFVHPIDNKIKHLLFIVLFHKQNLRQIRNRSELVFKANVVSMFF